MDKFWVYRPSRRRGFSLIECLVGLGVISVGLLGLIGALSYAVKASRTSEVASQAVGHAVHLVELVRTRNLDFARGIDSFGNIRMPLSWSGINDPEPPAAPYKPLNAYPFEDDFEPGPVFTRHISCRLATTTASPHLDKTMIVKATVYWEENGSLREFSFEALHNKP